MRKVATPAENYDTIKFINSKTLSTFPENKFDDDNFYQRNETILVLSLDGQEEKKHVGKSGNSSKKRQTGNLAIKWNTLIFQRKVVLCAQKEQYCAKLQTMKMKTTTLHGDSTGTIVGGFFLFIHLICAQCVYIMMTILVYI